MFNLASVLKLLPAVGPAVAMLPEFKKVFDQITNTFKEDDQQHLKEAYLDLIADNDAGHKRLQEKLRAAGG